MPRQQYSLEQKVRASESYLSGAKSSSELAMELGMGKSRSRDVRRWAAAYRANGIEAFSPDLRSQGYSGDLKLLAVESYLNGDGSLDTICNRYKILSRKALRSWIRKYNNGEELLDTNPNPEVEMAQRKKTTQQERQEIVDYCLQHGRDYQATATKFGVSYGQVYSWVKKFYSKGYAGLSDKRGHRKSDEELDEMERLRRDNKRLERALREKEMVIALLKKKRDIERMLNWEDNENRHPF